MLDKITPETTDDVKRNAVLDGAMALFMAHGFRRVTMEDIANAAGMSRPALYLVFRNKTDIYRALAGQFLDQCVKETAEGLARPGKLADRLDTVLGSVVFGIIDSIEATPHGAELIDLKTSLAQDIVEQCVDEVCSYYAAAIEADASGRGIDLAARGLSAAGLANTLICGVDGAKQRFPGNKQRREAVADLIRVIELAIA